MKPINSIYIVNAGNDAGSSSIANDSSFPALSVLALGTWLNKYLPDIEVTARDGGIMSQEEILREIQEIKPDMVGVSVLSSGFGNSEEIARYAKDCGSYVVLGNDQASHLGERILEQMPYVDFILGSEYGERPLEFLIRSLRGEQILFRDIPDLMYRERGVIRGFNFDRDKALLSIVNSPLYNAESRRTALDIFPIIDRLLYPTESHWQKYLQNYLKTFSHLHGRDIITGVTTMNRARGCSRAREAIKCNFCDMFLDTSFSSPELFWREVIAANQQVNANIIYEVFDSFSSFPRFLDSILKSRPQLDFDPKFFIYAQALDIARNPQIIQQFKELGVFKVNVGIESGSNTTLRHMKGPRDSVENNHMVLRMLKDAGIHIYGSFVLGSQAETPESLKETVEWAKIIMTERLIDDVESQPIAPQPQNSQGKQLISSGLLPRTRKNRFWDLDHASQTFIDTFSGVSFQDTLDAAMEIREAGRECGLNFGSGTTLEDHFE